MNELITPAGAGNQDHRRDREHVPIVGGTLGVGLFVTAGHGQPAIVAGF